MHVTVKLDLDINVSEWITRNSDQSAVGATIPPHIRAKVSEEVQAHVENVIRDLYFDQGWIDHE